ncbi:MAG: O-succinylbenzoate synthase [Actinomycetota bacterium]|nr:O-succinylbenzoate synthase [Actinomycetota bacterium]
MAIPFRLPSVGEGLRRITLLDGPSGWGECSPLPGYPCDTSMARRAAEEAACGMWPRPLRDEVEVNALVPALPPEAAARRAAEAAGEGFRAVKVKVGCNDDDESRVRAVRDAVGPAVRVRLDVNGSWDVETAVNFINRLSGIDLELVEQPVETIEELAQVRRRVSVPIAADESVRCIDDARRLARDDAADAVVVKVQCLGGIAAAMAIVDTAAVAPIVSSLYESSIGLAAGVALAAALPDLPYACGLGAGDVLAGDVVAEPLVAVNGRLAVRRPVADPALLARYRDV